MMTKTITLSVEDLNQILDAIGLQTRKHRQLALSTKEYSSVQRHGAEANKWARLGDKVKSQMWG